MTENTAENTAEATKASRQAVLNQASAAAMATIKAENIDRFNELMIKEAQDRGEKWSPRLTPEQRAEQDLADLIARFPNLADKIG